MTTKRILGPSLYLLIACTPRVAQAQMRSHVTLFELAPTIDLNICSAKAHERGPAWDAMLASRGMEDDEARHVLAALQDSLTVEAVARPTDVELQYVLATVIGVRTEVEGGRTKVRFASALHVQAEVVLSLNPNHPGAQHLLGRLHAAVMRMNRIKRFVATRVLGGGALAGASWEEAERLLEAAASGDPCIADHHYELALLYAERKNLGAARRQIDKMLRLTGSRPEAEAIVEKAVVLLEDLDHGF